MEREYDKKQREPARPRDRDAAEDRASVQPGFTSAGPSGSEGGRALYGDAPEEVGGGPPSRSEGEAAGWQRTGEDWPRHKGPIATQEDLPPRAVGGVPAKARGGQDDPGIPDDVFEEHESREREKRE